MRTVPAVATKLRGVVFCRTRRTTDWTPRIVSVTGLTRDGTFLIENGKISRPVTNFRFNQTIAELLAHVEMLGPAVRVPAEESGATGAAAVVPALKARDFNLASVSDAI